MMIKRHLNVKKGGKIPPQLKKFVMAKTRKSQNEKESIMVKKKKKVAKALKKASALHKKQSKVIETY